MNKKLFYRVINIICVLMVLGTTIWLIAYWRNIPAEIPTHFDLYGNPDAYGSKKDIIMLPILTWIMLGVMSIVECFPGTWNTGVKVTPENSARVYSIIKGMLVWIKLFVMLIFVLLIIFSALAKALPVWLVPVEMVLIFGIIIVTFVRLFRAR
ncbi:MAG: DUF1648 domain-containing protein [Lachnospiraceae bacterium]|nr:DUF1648 domain-containing protein [Lachnospiraceae bacterium]